MKVYIVYTYNCVYNDKTIIKGFTDPEKAIELAVNVVMEKNHKYSRDYVKEIIHNRFNESHTVLFMYTDYSDMEDNDFVGIAIVDVD